MKPNEYQLAAHRTNPTDKTPIQVRFDSRMIDLVHTYTGLLTEAGEIGDTVKKVLFYGRPLDQDAITNLKEELGDVLWYVALGCTTMGFDLGQVMEANIAKLRKRFPEKFTEIQARVRDTKTEIKAITDLDSPSNAMDITEFAEIIGTQVPKMTEEEAVVLAARDAHAANDAHCVAYGQPSYGKWEDISDAARASIISEVWKVLESLKEGKVPVAGFMHQEWLNYKLAAGWKYGPTKSEVHRTHPNIIPFAKLTVIEQAKDMIFISVVASTLKLLLPDQCAKAPIIGK